MAAAKKLAFRGISASAVELAGYEDLLLSEEAFSTSDDLDEYSFSGVPTDISKDLNSAEKVSQLDLNAMGKKKKCLPRYLFRAYGPYSGGAHPNGPYKDLNSEDAITPHAFHKINGTTTGHKSASEIPDPAAMINGHLSSFSSIQSEFSSWSPSLLLALCPAEEKYNSYKSAHICVLDTYKIANGVYHVPNLIHVGLVREGRRSKPTGEFAMPYPEEYLVHGVVLGLAYVALSFDKIRDDLLKVYPVIRGNQGWGYDIREAMFSPRYLPVNIIDEHVKLLKSIAKRFDRPELFFPLTVSFICLVKRFGLDYNAQRLLRSPDFPFYKGSLRSIVTHMDLTDNWLVNDHQYTGIMSEVKQAKIMMRALIWSKYGKGGRTTETALAAAMETAHINAGI